MDTLENMRVLVRVVEVGSFTAAGKSLGLATSVVSRAVSDLETRLRTRLLTRTTRKLALTAAGERYVQRCHIVLNELDKAEEEASNAMEAPRGVLRVFTFASLGQHHVLPIIQKYRERYRDVKVELTLNQHTPKFYDGSTEVAVVAAAELPDSEVVAYLLGSTVNIVCASPEYLARSGTPSVPSDLLNHECLTLKTPTFPTNEWRLESPEEIVEMQISGTVEVNIAESMVAAIHGGMGIGALPLYSAVPGLQNGKLVRVLPNYTLQSMNIYVLYPSRKFLDAKTRTFVDVLRESLPKRLLADRAWL